MQERTPRSEWSGHVRDERVRGANEERVSDQ
ncbi:hypothetical protein EDD27_10810 [Nonomuraea polychroma]|uniref:Uncharacterized protein n=1 Tax=Nonomuraea polychroma TaxID=46176 RepID=A0A438MPS8_9ACTN|nr:hypothetical protein EDD27_10810 [Nonomuraea polychroma]